MSARREQILHAAAELLTRKPTSAMEDVAQAAGISRATLHRHFSSRQRLVRSLEELGIGQLDQAVEESRLEEGRADEALRRLVDETRPLAGFLAFLVTENQLFEPEGMHAGWQRLDSRIEGLFRRGQEEGVFRLDLSTAWLTEAFYALVSASAWAVQDGKLAVRDSGRMTVELLLGGSLRTERS